MIRSGAGIIVKIKRRKGCKRDCGRWCRRTYREVVKKIAESFGLNFSAVKNIWSSSGISDILPGFVRVNKGKYIRLHP
jgi:hypothetical protein